MPEEARGRGDPRDVLGQAVVAHHEYLRAFVRTSLPPALRDLESVSDIVQSTIRQVLATPGSFEYRSDAELRAYLRQAAHNKILNRIRRGTTGKHAGASPPADADSIPERHDSTPGPIENVVRNEELERLRKALDELPEDVGEVVRLHRVLGLSLQEIAALRSEPATTIGSRVHRGMTLLASRIGALE